MKRLIIETVRKVASSLPGWMMPKKFKYVTEFWFWKTRTMLEGPVLANDFYKDKFLDAAGFENDDWTEGKVIADFGCGPRGSLCWATRSARRIGIDVLTDKYRELGIEKHDMEYVKSTEKDIPLESGIADVVTTFNAIDHVIDFPAMVNEMMRILKPGGLFIASINLDEAPTFCEPQTLTEEMVNEHLLLHLEVGRKVIEDNLPKGRKMYLRGTKLV